MHTPSQAHTSSQADALKHPDPPVRARRWAAGLAVGLMASASVAGCSTARQDEARANAHLGASTCPVAPNESVTGRIRVGYQAIPNANLYVKDQRLLEVCLPKASIQWLKFDSGADVVQAFGANSVDLATLGSSPATKALSAPLNISMQVVWIDDVIGAAESLVARDASVTSLRQLKGRTIATPFGSTSHYSLLQALAASGMAASDVKLVNLSPDKMMAAWQGHQIDAAWVWDPVLSQLLANGHMVTGSDATAKAGHPTFDLEGATTAFVQSHPDALETWTAVQDAAVKKLASDPGAASESIAVELGSSPALVAKQLKGYTYPDAAGQVARMKALPGQLLDTATFLRTQQGIDSVSPLSRYEGGVHTDAITKVAHA